jgi:hypothetical protein
MPTTVLDFFVSYNRQDWVWAGWIAWTLEDPSPPSRIHPALLIARAFMPVRAAGLSQSPAIGKHRPHAAGTISTLRPSLVMACLELILVLLAAFPALLAGVDGAAAGAAPARA